MRLKIRRFFDSVFTCLTVAVVVLIVLILLVILGPMSYKGTSAVFFKGTVEFRKLQLARYDRGDQQQLNKEIIQTREVRKVVYEKIDSFKQGINTEQLEDKADDIYDEYGKQIKKDENVSREQYYKLRIEARKIRNRLEDAFSSDTNKEANEHLEYVLSYEGREKFAGTKAEEFFTFAEDFKQRISSINLADVSDYKQQLQEVEDIIVDLFGPRPGQPLPPLTMNRYGATRWDKVQILLSDLKTAEKWEQTEPGKPLQKVEVPRKEIFAGTPLESLFGYVDKNIKEMFKPRFTFYWQYFIDDSTPGHYFGGVGPEILGTLLLTVTSMLFVIPLGVISAAYLAECASDNMIIRIIRMCINTLAGVPSIVFGLFGLAFFVLFLFPALNLQPQACILTASLTLAILTLPVMIRASEEAIRTVPTSYKQASLALGASRFRTFMTVTLPTALPGILTGVILSLGRVAGETAPILFTGAVAFGPAPNSLFDPTPALSYASYDMAVGDRLATLVPHKQYGMVVTLIVLVLLMNLLSIILRSKIFKKLQGR
jgi:phosphate transport system permease protein